LTIAAFSPTHHRMTGLEVAQRSKCPVSIAEENRYWWWQQEITLTDAVAASRSPFGLLSAAHEAAHHAQNIAHPWLKWLRLLEPVRWWSEWDAWRRAVQALI
jgi:hypothetical protein